MRNKLPVKLSFVIVTFVLMLLFALLVSVFNWGNWLAIGWALMLALLCVYRHKTNIGRLLRGEENKFSIKK